MSSEMADDLLSDILRLVGAQPFIGGSLAAGGTWAVRFPRPGKIKFLALLAGNCWLRIETEAEPVRLEQGDVLLLSGDYPFVLASDANAEPVDAVGLFAGGAVRNAKIGDGNGCFQIGGHVDLDPSSGALLIDVLPPLIHVRASSEQAAILQWLLERLVKELGANLPGSSIASIQLAQLMFVEILRVYLANGSEIPGGWLRAIGDARLVPALRLMHRDPGRAWRLDELAAASAMSRTAFAVHFKAVVGMAPLTWLTAWRMHMARRALIEEAAPIAVLAGRFGYASESAFSSAFKRVAGQAPRDYRRAARTEPRA